MVVGKTAKHGNNPTGRKKNPEGPPQQGGTCAPRPLSVFARSDCCIEMKAVGQDATQAKHPVISSRPVLLGEQKASIWTSAMHCIFNHLVGQCLSPRPFAPSGGGRARRLRSRGRLRRGLPGLLPLSRSSPCFLCCFSLSLLDGCS